MENKNFSFDVAHQKLLPMHVLEGCRECESVRVERKYSRLAVTIKVVAVLTMVSACFTAIVCAVYCNSALNDIKRLHIELTELSKTKSFALNHSEINYGNGAASKLEKLTALPNVDHSGKKQNSRLFVDNPAIDPDKSSDYRNDNEHADDGSHVVVDDAYDVSGKYDYGSDDYGDDETDNYDQNYDDSQDDYNDEKKDSEGFFDDLDDDDSDGDYDEEYDYSDNEDSNSLNEDFSDTNDIFDLDEDYEETSGNVIDDEDLRRVRRDTEKQKKKRKKGKGKKDKNKQRKQKQKKVKSLPAAQFHANITEEELMLLGVGYNAYKLTDECAYSSEMNGIYCLNKTFTPNARQPLRIFKKENWVDDQKSPITMQGNKFLVKSSGTHLVYGQITMEGKLHPVSASITRERFTVNGKEEQYLTCTNDCIPETCTCSIFGLMNLKTGDTLYVQTNNGLNKILFEEASTYMGVVQLNRDQGR